MKKIISILTVSVLLTACSKSDDKALTQAPVKNYLKSEAIDVFNGTTTFTLSSNYTYNSQNQIIGIEETSSDTNYNPNKSYTNFVYNSKGKLESYQFQYTMNGTTYNYKNTYIYSPESVVQEMTTTNLATNTITQRNTYEYTTNGLTFRYIQASGVVSQTNIYKYNGDNISQIEYKNQSGTTIFIQNYNGYDNKPNPLQLKWESVPDKLRSINNSNSEVKTISSTGAVTTTQYNYEYNADGYPTKRIDITSGRTATWTYEKR